MAIHDREYSSRPATFAEFRWRLQYLAELGVGRLLRADRAAEDQAARNLAGRVG